ncbi:MAG: GNAT family N-acetyltransferase [Kofleriaceae bacterium]
MTSAPRATIPELGDLDLVIKTDRLVLRPLRETDVDDLWPVVSDPEFPKLMSWEAHRDRGETVELVQRQARGIAENTHVVWGIEHDGRIVGCIGLHDITWRRHAWRLDRAELGYWLAPALWRRNLMTEAAREVVNWGFTTLGLHKIVVGCIEQNAGSRRVIEKLGFRMIGRMVDDVWRDGAWSTHLRFELCANDWFDVTTTTPIVRSDP